MKLKKVLAAIAVCAMSATVLTMTVSAAGVDADDDTLDDGDEIVEIEDDEEDETPVDDAADEDETPAAPVEDTTPAPNPPTGNSPIALAVIPVALAAAAVVAKKAK